jgi:hypothetical protein
MGIGANTGDGQDGYHHALYPIYVTNSEIARNNVNGYDVNWEGGGAKFWETKDSIIAHNYVHDNVGAGLWDDGWNDNITYDHNRITRSMTGITHEIGSSALITHNVIDVPARTDVSAQTCQAAICIASSDGVQSDTSHKTIEVEANYLRSGGFGIVVAKTHPDVIAGHVNVTNNTIPRARQAVAWTVDNQHFSIFHFDGNHYAPGEQFGFSEAVHSWTEWQQYGGDVHGDMRAEAHGPPKAAGIARGDQG